MNAEDAIIGARVRRTWSPPMRIGIPVAGDLGTIQVSPDPNGSDTLVGVQWDDFTEGHSNDLDIPEQEDGWYVPLDQLALVENPSA